MTWLSFTPAASTTSGVSLSLIHIYIAVGNEEVGEPFFERYPYFHKAIREKYPDIKIINTASPFAGGGEYERGWKSARENRSDLVDEHYYMAPELSLIHI